MTTAPSPIPGYLNTTQAAQRVRRTKGHISYLCKTGKVKSVRIGRDWLVEELSLDAYIASEPRPGAKPKRERTK